jgi:hypothetical protein
LEEVERGVECAATLNGIYPSSISAGPECPFLRGAADPGVLGELKGSFDYDVNVMERGE